MTQYKIGFVSISKDSNKVTGSQTRWISNHIQPGDLFKISGFDLVLEVSSVESEDILYLTSKWPFDNVNNLSHIISRDFTPHYNFPEIRIGDRDWPSILTRSLRKMDSLMYKLNTEGVQLPDAILQESRIASIEEIDTGTSNDQIVSVYGLAHAINEVDTFSGDYDGLTNKPELYTDEKAVAAINTDTNHGADSSHNYFSGNYNDLTNRPDLFSGNYLDLSSKPELYTYEKTRTAINTDPSHGSDASHNYFSGNYNDLSDKPSLFSGSYGDLSNKPNLFSGSFNNLTDKPTGYTPTAHTHSLDDINKSGAVNGQVPVWSDSENKYIPGIVSGNGSGYTDSMAVNAVNSDVSHSFNASHSYTDLLNKPFIPELSNKESIVAGTDTTTAVSPKAVHDYVTESIINNNENFDATSRIVAMSIVFGGL